MANIQADDIAAALEALRARRPLVQNITNYVAMTISANVLLALGASPAMVHALEEVEDFVAISDALVANIGTLSPPWVEAMRRAVLATNEANKPWVLDPVGCGATPYRTATAAALAGFRPAVIRGNASEIMSLAGATAERPKGVDSAASSEAAVDAARSLAQRTGAIVAVTGVTDYATDGANAVRVEGGHALMPLSTALGCALSAVTAAFCAVSDPMTAAVAALAVFKVAGAEAAKRCRGPGHLPAELCDALHLMDDAALRQRARIGGGLMQTSFTLAQLADPDISEADKILRACVHCGFCTATCPTYVLLGDELDSPRGRIYLIKDMLENDRPASEDVTKHIDRCLSCLACMTTCPSGVHYMHLVDHARAHIEQTYRRPWTDRLIRNVLAAVLPYPARFRAALAAAWLPGRLLALFSGHSTSPRKPIPAGEGVATLILRVIAMLRLAPARPPICSAYEGPRTFPPERSRKGRVVLLQGCAQAVLAGSINEAAIRLLTRSGIEVVLAAGEGCCGSLVHHMGREHQARAQARRNVDVWTREMEGAGLDAILITASGCGTTIKDYGFMLRGEAAYADKAARVSALARDISEYLAAMDLTAPVQANGLKVAYQSACSLQHGQKITRQPKDLLANAGFRVSDIAEAHLCCGSAGTYNIMQPDIAATLRDRKAANIKATGADVVATGNIGCMTQIAPATGIPVVHTVELLDWAHGGPVPEALKHVRIPANDSRRIANAT